MKRLILLILLLLFFIKGKAQLSVYPNPFTTTLTVTYSLATTDTVTIEVIDVLGQIKTKLINDSVINAGIDSLIYHPTTLSSGIYFVAFFTKHDTAVKKVVYQGSASAIQTISKQNEKTLIYPNPVTDVFYIETTETDVEIKITDILGKEVLITKNKKIDVSSLGNGVYFVALLTGENISTQKFIVQH